MVRDSLWALAGNLALAASQYGVALAFSNLTGVETFASYVLALSIASPLFVLANLRLRTIQVTDAEDEYSLRDYVTARLFTGGLALAVATVTAAGVFGASLTTFMVVSLSTAKLIELVDETWHGVLQRRSAFAQLALSCTIRSLLTVGAVLAGLLAGSTEAALVGLPVAALSALVADVLRFPRVRRDLLASHADRARIWRLARTGLPLGLSSAIGALQASVPRYYLQALSGPHDLARFAAASYLFIPFSFALTAAAQVATPRLSLLFSRRERGPFFALTWKLMALGVGVGAALMGAGALFGGPAVGLLFGDELTPPVGVVIALAVHAALSFSFVFLGTALTSARIYSLHAPTTILSTVVVAALCHLLVPRLGPLGAAYALAGGALTGAAVLTTSGLPRLREALRPDLMEINGAQDPT